MIEPKLTVRRAAIDSLKPDPENVRLHSDRNLAAIQSSLEAFGQQKPIVVRSDGTVVAGNGTLEAAKALGWTEIDVVETTLEGAELRAFAIADNRTAELAEWDRAALAVALAAIKAETDDVGLTGFTEAEMKALADEVPGGGYGVGSAEGLAQAASELIYRVSIDCPNEQAQAALIQRLEAEGFVCRPSIL